MRAISVFSFETGTSTRWCLAAAALRRRVKKSAMGSVCIVLLPASFHDAGNFSLRSEEHTSELQSHSDLVCRLLLEKKKKNNNRYPRSTAKLVEELGTDTNL